MVQPEIVRRKLAQLEAYLAELERHRGITLDQYVTDVDARRVVERRLQLVVEVVADINVHCATELESKPPTDYKDSFHAAARCGIIPGELARRLAPAAGLRNVLVHEYENVDDAIVHATIKLALDGFREYAAAVVGWLEQNYPG